MIYGDEEELPLGYSIYQGNIGDVSTFREPDSAEIEMVPKFRSRRNFVFRFPFGYA